MSHSTADRNLLVGMLALQLNFVSREQLIAATSKWTRDKKKSIADILSSDGVLSEKESRLLDGLVDMHLARHDNDPLQTLASIDAARAARDVVEATGDATMLETINHLAGVDPHQTLAPTPLPEECVDPPNAPASPDASESPDAPQSQDAGEDDRFATTAPVGAAKTLAFGPSRKGRSKRGKPAPAPADTPTPACRYTILKPYQRGGLGQVSIARDEEINREVALKEILPKHADSDEARARFLMEAEITGSLEHPGVVPVYGLGQYADGRPYYAMRFIRGDNLQLAIEEFHRGGGIKHRDLPLRQLLRRFTDVCNAIEYAHNRCVLHRDLKPGNIMLGKYGETLVVDWGLAKSLDAQEVPTDTIELPIRPLSADSTTETQLGRVVGTPAYMSPEQASGRVDILGPATDIYSLGATLFHLLTGEAPFAGTPREALIGNVQMGRFRSPREVRADVPRALEAITLKAMARAPEHRYHTAHALAEDIERYLADEPVAAYGEPWHARAFRWMRKHRAWVVGAAGILTVTAIALTLGIILLGAANRRVEAQRQLAEQNSQRAERNFEMARNAVRDYFTSVSEDTLLNQSGMQPLRNELLGLALEYYEQFLKSDSVDPAMRDDVAQAYFFVGIIKEDVESPEIALPYYDQALTLYEELTRETPTDRRRLDEYGMTLNAKGRALQILRRFEEAQELYEEARAMRARLVEMHPDDPEFTRQLANTVMNLGTIAIQRGDQDQGLELWQQAQALRLAKLAEGIELATLLRDYGKGSFNLGHLYLSRNAIDAARGHLGEAIQTFEKLVKQSPNMLESQLNLALAYRQMGELAPAEPSDDAAGRADLANYERAIELLARLALRNPQVPKYSEELAGARITYAEVLIEIGRREQGLTVLAKSLETLRGLAEQYPDEPFYREELIFARDLSAAALLATDQREAAAAELRQALAEAQELVDRYPAEAVYRNQADELRKQLEELGEKNEDED